MGKEWAQLLELWNRLGSSSGEATVTSKSHWWWVEDYLDNPHRISVKDWTKYETWKTNHQIRLSKLEPSIQIFSSLRQQQAFLSLEESSPTVQTHKSLNCFFYSLNGCQELRKGFPLPLCIFQRTSEDLLILQDQLCSICTWWLALKTTFTMPAFHATFLFTLPKVWQKELTNPELLSPPSRSLMLRSWALKF